MLKTLPWPNVMPGSRLHVHGVPWSKYSKLLKTFSESPSVRLTYDGGELEIMSPLLSHEDDSRFFYCLVMILAEEWELPFKHGGSVTLRRKSKLKGLEPDECFWIASAAGMKAKRRLNLNTDPPPDLAIEIEATRSALDRVKIYGALGIPELWRFSKKGLTFLKRGSKSNYRKVATSLSFPGLTSQDLSAFLARLQHEDDMFAVLRSFRTFARKLKPKPTSDE